MHVVGKVIHKISPVIDSIVVIFESKLLQEIFPFGLSLLLIVLFDFVFDLLDHISSKLNSSRLEAHLEQSSMWIWRLWEQHMNQLHHTPIPKQVRMQPGNLAHQRQILSTELAIGSEAQDIALIIQEAKSLLEGNAGYHVPREPVDVLDHIDGFAFVLLHQINEDGDALIDVRLVVTQICHRVYLCCGTPQHSMLLRVSNCKHVVELLAFVVRR